MLFMLLQDYFKHDSVYELHHIYYPAKLMLNKHQYLSDLNHLKINVHTEDLLFKQS